MTEPVTAARTQLREIAADLEALRFRLLGVHASLPPDEEPSFSTGVRAALECILADSLEPAIRDLQAAAHLKVAEGEPEA